jgi:hypothetical protein
MKTTLIMFALIIGQILTFKEWWEDAKVLLI